jgi:drug/metabolite transporter (DMT)-like permease
MPMVAGRSASPIPRSPRQSVNVVSVAIDNQPQRAGQRLPVPVILGVSMTAAGVVYPVTDAALHHTSPIMIATLRALAGGALLTLILPLMRSRLPRTRRLWGWAFGIGFGNTTLTQVGISVGTQRAGSAVAAVLLNSSPFFVALIARFALGESITRLRTAGLIVGFAGVLVVVLSHPGTVGHGSQLALGLVLSLLGALGWAGGGLGMRVLTQREPELDIPGITAAQFLSGGVPLIPLVLLAGGSTDWGRPTLDAQLVFLVLGGQVLVYLGFNAALGRWPSTRVYAWTFLVPAVAVVIDAIQGMLPNATAVIGVALVIVGVAIVNLPRAEGEPIEPHGYEGGDIRQDAEPTFASGRENGRDTIHPV